MSLRVGTVTPRYFASLTLTPVAVATTNGVASQTFTVQGLQTDMLVVVNENTTRTAGVWLVAARVSAANTLELDFFNATGGSLTPAAGEYRVVAF